mgnify:CR=1 FL=1
MKNKILQSVNRFNLNLQGKNVLTEAATGNFVVTPIIAAVAGATVHAFTKDSKYGDICEVKKQTMNLARELQVSDKIDVITNLDELELQNINIVTNSGFLRPINKELINKLSSKCVIPLMWEPWEYREKELDLEACRRKGIKVYGTNENDPKLKTVEYLGPIAKALLNEHNIIPRRGKILIAGSNKFVIPVEKYLNNHFYDVQTYTNYKNRIDANSIKSYSTIVLIEHERNDLIIGDNDALINLESINKNTFVLHIAGNVNLEGGEFDFIPEQPAPFGHMSYTTDYLDNTAVIDLNVAGLKVAEGMLRANSLCLEGEEYKDFLESDYYALAFNDPKYL